MAKLKATETGKKVALEGMQMMGGYGYATEYDMQNHVRMNLVSTIYGGTSEIQREIIAKTHGLVGAATGEPGARPCRGGYRSRLRLRPVPSAAHCVPRPPSGWPARPWPRSPG